MTMRYSLRILAATAALALAAAPAHAAVTISSGATQNMSCSGHICTPTAKRAVLNVGDLENFLASGNLTVTTTGTGVQADDIEVKVLVTWSTSDRLVLDAYHSIIVDKPVSAVGLSGLTLTTDDGGANGILSFGPKGNVTFANLSSQLTINASPYALVGDIKTLASDIASNPGGDFALAANYDASADGTYNSCPVPTEFTGTFNGLGNTISNLSINGATNIGGTLVEGLFAELATDGVLENIGLVNANISTGVKFVSAGPLNGISSGTIDSAYATGRVAVGKQSTGGGLVGLSVGAIVHSHASDDVTGRNGDIGGLVGYNGGAVEDSYATGKLRAGKSVGGLVGGNGGTIS